MRTRAAGALVLGAWAALWWAIASGVESGSGRGPIAAVAAVLAILGLCLSAGRRP